MIGYLEQDQEGNWLAQTYQEGRVTFVIPEKKPGIPQWQTFFTKEEAQQRILFCFPGTEILDYEQFYHIPEQEGYYWPGRFSRTTNLLCACGDYLYIKDPRQGYNTPYNSLHSTHYNCKSCAREYIRSQEGWYGSVYWQCFLDRDDSSTLTSCDEPLPDLHNAFGFYEMRLEQEKKEQEEEEQ
jgi:hypothetical protein